MTRYPDTGAALIPFERKPRYVSAQVRYREAG